MTKAQHTPGPWKYDYRSGLISHDEQDEIGFSGIVIMHALYKATEERQANARLIAAAPELLAYAECSDATSTHDSDHWGRVLLSYGWNSVAENPGEFIQRMRKAAIAKARGEA